ncbi:hypothetical protein C0J52_28387 [Blattella germanica]|nr:hypothetical protein C0J52_28387 [Blattella germanica]
MFPCRRKSNVFRLVCCQRWSFSVPLLLYASLFGMAWMLSLPLKSSKIVPLYSEKEVEKWPNHLEGVRLERDGEINANFRKEVIIGDSPPFEDPKALLEDIFHKYVIYIFY